MNRNITEENLKSTRSIFFGLIMFTVVVKGELLCDLVDFDRVIKAIDALPDGQEFKVVLVDWIDEEEVRGVIFLRKRDETTLMFLLETIQSIDYKHVMGAFKIFYTVLERSGFDGSERTA